MAPTTGTTRFESWRHELRDRRFRLQLLVSVPLLIVILSLFTRFLEWVEHREGVVINDPILTMIEPVDLTWVTFGLIYLAIILALSVLSKEPKTLLLAIQAYTLMVVVRMGMMYLVPLNPAEGLIVLKDPLVQFVGNGSAPTKDLFFSGHTSTMFLLALVSNRTWLRRVFLSFTLLVAVCVIWQHVHYVIDVAVAPFVAYAAFRSSLYVREKL